MTTPLDLATIAVDLAAVVRDRADDVLARHGRRGFSAVERRVFYERAQERLLEALQDYNRELEREFLEGLDPDPAGPDGPVGILAGARCFTMEAR